MQARIVAYSDSDEEDFNRNKWQAGTGSESDGEDAASPVDHDTATVNVKQKQLIRKPPPGNTVSIGAGPGVAAVAGFCGQHITPKVNKVLVPQNAVRVSHIQQQQSARRGNTLIFIRNLQSLSTCNK